MRVVGSKFIHYSKYPELRILREEFNLLLNLLKNFCNLQLK